MNSLLELELIAGFFLYAVRCTKGELLISEKDITRDIVFVEKGLLRQFYFKGRDVTENFACDGDGAMCIVSLFTGRRNCLQLESLEEGVIWSILCRTGRTL